MASCYLCTSIVYVTHLSPKLGLCPHCSISVQTSGSKAIRILPSSLMLPTPIHHRLLGATEDFLSSISKGQTAMDSFVRRWSDLQHDVTDALNQQILSIDTACLARSVTETMSVLANTIHDFEHSANAISTDFTRDVESILDDAFPTQKNVPRSSTTPPSDDKQHPCPP